MLLTDVGVWDPCCLGIPDHVAAEPDSTLEHPVDSAGGGVQSLATLAAQLAGNMEPLLPLDEILAVEVVANPELSHATSSTQASEDRLHGEPHHPSVILPQTVGSATAAACVGDLPTRGPTAAFPLDAPPYATNSLGSQGDSALSRLLEATLHLAE